MNSKLSVNSNTDSLCDFCLSSKSKYCCSRCHRKYCSSDCYKCVEHMQCSEQFFRQCVSEELLFRRFDDSSKHKLLEILKRNENLLTNDLISEDIEDNEDIVDETQETEDSFENRFKGLETDDSRLIWNQLSDSEKQEFNQLLRSGKIGELIDVWNPWWKWSTDGSTTRLVTPLDEFSVTSSEDNVSDVPELMSNIRPLNELISKPTSPAVCPAVLSTIISYCYVCRLYNGEYDSLESMEVLLRKCPQLSDNIICEDLSKSLEMSVQLIMTEQPKHMAIELLYDLKCLISGPKLRTESFETPEYVLRAFSHLFCIINKVKKNCSKRKTKEMKLQLILKKLEFYMSWTVANGKALFESINQINLKIDTLLLTDDCNQSQEMAEELRRKLRPKTLIEEMS